MADVEINTTSLREALRLCVDALNESDPIHDDYWAAAKAGEDALAGADPICIRCASQQEGPVPTECTCSTPAAGFSGEEYAHTAKLLRSDNEQIVRTAASNNLNIILAALDLARAKP